MPDFKQISIEKLLPIAKQGIMDNLKGLLEQAGLPKLDNVADVAKHAGSWKGLWQKLTEKGLEKLGAKEAIEAALVAGSEVVVPGSGLVMGSAFAAGGMFHANKRVFQKGPKPSKAGDWVAIDNGPERLKRITKAALSYGEAAMFGDTPGQSDFDLEVQEVISIGFFIQNGSDKDTFQVFNFETKETEERKRDEVMLLPAERQLKINNHPVFGKIRELVLHQHLSKPEGATLKGAVCVDRGAEVVFRGEPYRVVSSAGNLVKISNKKQSYEVAYQQLRPGRQKHNTGWNYGSTPGGFSKDSKPVFRANQWVWISPARASSVRDAKHRFEVRRELGVIRLLNGTLLDGYYAIDGVRFQLEARNVRPASRSEEGWLSLDKDFVRFQDAAATGNGTRRLRLGGDYLGICLGKVLTMEAPVLDWAASHQGEFSDEGQVEGQAQALVMGTPGAAQDPVDGTPAQKAANAKARLQSQHEPGSQVTAGTPDPSKTFEATPIVLVTVGAAALLAFMYFGK